MTTTTTDRRALVAEAIYQNDNRGAFHHYHQGSDASIRRYEQQADAVLSALEPWLLPELPETTGVVHLNTRSAPGEDDRWGASVEGDYGPIEDGTYRHRMQLDGTGPTPTAAIRAALNGETA